MNVDGKPYRTIRPLGDGRSVEVIDQTRLPHEFAVRKLSSAREAALAISTMVVRGAPLIGAPAAYGSCVGLRDDPAAAGYEDSNDTEEAGLDDWDEPGEDDPPGWLAPWERR